MNPGKIPEHNLEKAVLGNVRKLNNDINVFSGIGNDYSCMGGVITTDGTGSSPVIAWAKAYNNFSCSGGICDGARISFFLSESAKESRINSYMQQLCELTSDKGVQILGGNTEIVPGIDKDYFTVTLIGKEGNWREKRKLVCEKHSIIMIGYAGMLGTNQLIKDNAEKLEILFGNHFSKGFLFDSEEYIGINPAEELAEMMEHVFYLHDVSAGGVYAALWQMGKALGKGIEVINSKIPIKQETIELCESVDLNPYLIDGTGAILLVCDEASAVLHAIRDLGYRAELIGHFTSEKERVVRFGEDEYRTLAPTI